MAKYPNLYPALKAVDPVNAAAIVAAAAQAFGWEPSGVGRFCKLIGASPTEIDGIVRQARAAKDAGAAWFPAI